MKRFLKNKKLVILLLVLLGILGISLGVLAITIEDCRNVAWPTSPSGFDINPTLEGEKCVYADFPTLVAYIYEWGIALGGLAAFIALVIAGFQYLTSVGNPAVMKEAMDRIKSASLGLVLLLSSWLILNTINPELTAFRPLSFKPEGLPSAAEALVTQTESKPCDYARIYNAANYQGTYFTLKPGVRLYKDEPVPPPAGAISCKEADPMSGKSFRYLQECDYSTPCAGLGGEDKTECEEAVKEKCEKSTRKDSDETNDVYNPGGFAVNTKWERFGEEKEDETLYICKKGNEGKCPTKGGACTIQFRKDTTFWFGGDCNEPVGETSSFDPNFRKTVSGMDCICLKAYKPGEY